MICSDFLAENLLYKKMLQNIILFPEFIRAAVSLYQRCYVKFFALLTSYFHLRKQKELVFQHCESITSPFTKVNASFSLQFNPNL